MNSLNFSVLEVLPALLDKTKVQTIREVKYSVAACGGSEYVDLPPKFKVGDKVQIYWKKDSEEISFCRGCGSGLKDFLLCPQCGQLNTPLRAFNKFLGTVEITEVFKISLETNGKSGTVSNITARESFGKFPKVFNLSEPSFLAECDGFKSAEEMFRTLDKLYDLSQPKEFHVYRWRWLN